MEPIVYGIKTEPPTKEIAEAFGSDAKLVLLKGGQGTSYRSGNIVLKPLEGEKDNWMPEIFKDLPAGKDVRFARPIKSTYGTWEYKDYIAWSYLEGEHMDGKQYDKKVPASIEYHRLLKDVPKPKFLETAHNSWSTADLVAWDKLAFDYDTEFMELYDQIKPHLKKLDLPCQLVHGDISGNFLIDSTLPPAVIDFSPAWAPNGFAEGIMLIDSITWENANPKDLDVFDAIPNIEQFAWRGILRRVAEQPEHIKWFGKNKAEAIGDARAFQKAIDFLNKKGK